MRMCQPLNSLELRTKRLFIATEDAREPALLKLENAGLLHFFEGVVTSEETGVMKPSPRYYQTILRQTHAKPQGVVVVGDNFEKDLVPALLLGAHVLLVKAPGDLRRLRLLE